MSDTTLTCVCLQKMIYVLKRHPIILFLLFFFKYSDAVIFFFLYFDALMLKPYWYHERATRHEARLVVDWV